ncbi:hypothetical protein AWB78_07058 [Caballeronia calidae]|uniref:Uncharacterized protein n=1 Tax=Caballeronia calidae TaxID=1777139 RepID=A0A158ECJ6_9BURK|nr:hypothetical protein [Caballeronia calidae]SAL04611.1 hypothetical protein AWB78_07058 [Caballeronia calidae]
MTALTIEDLPMTKELEPDTLATVRGGIGRTPQQIQAWEISGKPATWQGLVLGDDGRLQPPSP